MNTSIISQQPLKSQYHFLKIGSGFVLLVFGIAGIILIANQIFLLIKAPQDLGIIAKFMEFSAQAITIVLPNGNIELPEFFNFALGAVFYIWLLGIAGSIINLLITSGVNLIQSRDDAILSELKDEISKLKGNEILKLKDKEK